MKRQEQADSQTESKSSRRPYRAPRVVLRDTVDVLCGTCDSSWGPAISCRTAALCSGPGQGVTT